ncbi:MAG TPA: hypothetical protein VF418_15225 [Sphingomonadaceae bacterium]
MDAIMCRLQGERWWAAEAALRAAGLALLALCAGATAWLYGSLHTPPPHQAGILEFFAGALIVLGWSTGWPLLLLGQGLFKPVILPGWKVGYSIPTRRQRDE